MESEAGGDGALVDQPHLGGDDQVGDARRGVAAEIQVTRERARLPRGHPVAAEGKPVDLQLGDVAQPEAQSQQRPAHQIAGETGHRELLLLHVVEAGFYQHHAAAHRLRVLGDERPLLRADSRRHGKRQQHPGYHHP